MGRCRSAAPSPTSPSPRSDQKVDGRLGHDRRLREADPEPRRRLLRVDGHRAAPGRHAVDYALPAFGEPAAVVDGGDGELSSESSRSSSTSADPPSSRTVSTAQK